MDAVFTQFALFAVSWLMAFVAMYLVASATKFAGKLAHVGVRKLFSPSRVSLNTLCRNGARLRVYTL